MVILCFLCAVKTRSSPESAFWRRKEAYSYKGGLIWFLPDLKSYSHTTKANIREPGYTISPMHRRNGMPVWRPPACEGFEVLAYGEGFEVLAYWNGWCGMCRWSLMMLKYLFWAVYRLLAVERSGIKIHFGMGGWSVYMCICSVGSSTPLSLLNGWTYWMNARLIACLSIQSWV